MKAAVYREYGIDKKSGHFEVDPLISLELGGADVGANLWPESYDTTPWNASVKDKIEDRLHAIAAYLGAAGVRCGPVFDLARGVVMTSPVDLTGAAPAQSALAPGS